MLSNLLIFSTRMESS